MPDQNTEQTTVPTSPSTTREVKVRVRAVPKFGTFGLFGAIVATIFAAIASIVTPASTGLSKGQAFGLLMLWSVPIGVAVFLALGLLLDWISRRRARQAVAVQEIVRDPASDDSTKVTNPTLAPEASDAASPTESTPASEVETVKNESVSGTAAEHSSTSTAALPGHAPTNPDHDATLASMHHSPASQSEETAR